MTRYNAIKKLYNSAEGPFYMLDLNQLNINYQSFITSIRKVHPDSEIGYSFKTNYTKDIIRLLSSMGAYSEIVSQLELDIAMSLGIKNEKIIFNGPFKKLDTIKQVLLGGGLVHIDCKEELILIQKILSQKIPLKPLRLGIRFNLASENYPSRFGLDINSRETLEVINIINQNEHLSLDALHIHYPDRSIDLFADRIGKFFNFIVQHFDTLPPIVNLGSGFYHEMSIEEANRLGLSETTKFDDYANVLSKLLPVLTNKFGDKFKLFFEPGTPLVVNCMKLVGQIFSIKEINKKLIATADISIFDFNPRSFPKKNHIEIVCDSPLETKLKSIIVGNTCVENDVIQNEYFGPISPNSFVVISNVGSYSNVMKPPFISLSLPIVVVDGRESFVRIVKKRHTSEQVISDYV